MEKKELDSKVMRTVKGFLLVCLFTFLPLGISAQKFALVDMDYIFKNIPDEAWFPTVGLYEKPQTKKNFVERIVFYLKNDEKWTVGDRYLNVDEKNMPMPEPLIVQYNLKNWMNNDYKGDDLAVICSPVVQTKYKGIYRNGE